MLISSVLLVEKDSLFHQIFEDACYLLNMTTRLEAIGSAEEADELFSQWGENPDGRPECVFIDANTSGTHFDGIELTRRINTHHGNGVVIGIISSSCKEDRIASAKQSGAQFWMLKDHDIMARLEEFTGDYGGYFDRTASFKVYR